MIDLFQKKQRLSVWSLKAVFAMLFYFFFFVRWVRSPGIRTGKIRKRRVFVYIMHENRPIGIPSIAYMQTCIQGYDDFGFDPLVLIDAYLKCGEDYYEGE